MTKPIALPILIHLCAALCALALGIVMLVRAKGTASHRILGRAWAATMLVVAISSLWIPSFLHFTPIHAFTVLTLVGLPVAIWRVRRGDVAGHARTMKSLFLGAIVVAGVFAFTPGRLLGNLLWKGVWG